MARGEAWSGSNLPPWFLYGTRDLTIDVEVNAPISEDFKGSDKKLVPVIFSHGLKANRAFYAVNAMEFASHGFIVFCMDHLDGSTAYTERKVGDSL